MAEARIVASKVDKTILVVRWRHSNRQTIRRSIKILKEFNASLIGAALNMVDTANWRYSFEESSSYRAYSSYYQKTELPFWKRILFLGEQKKSRLPTVPARNNDGASDDVQKDTAA